MIRRDVHLPGRPPGWLLIPQQAHAQLAGRLARAWRFEPPFPPPVWADLIAAIDQHDDGWPPWDDWPTVDSAAGRPRSFNEMPIRQTLAIWPASIAVARRLGPLVGWLVAGHFRALLHRSGPSWDASRLEKPLVEAFLDQCERDRSAWLGEWLAAAADRGEREARAARRALAALQTFDWASLWLCCHDFPEPTVLEIPGQAPVNAACVSSGIIELDPWPLVVPQLALSVTGRLVTAHPYADDADFAAAPARPHELCWTLRPRPVYGAIGQSAGAS